MMKKASPAANPHACSAAHSGRRHAVILATLCLLLLPLGFGRITAAPRPHPALATLPATILWAWERPEDLRWLAADVGVAYVASTIVLRGDQALVQPRRNPLLMADTTPAIPVLHVDASWRTPPVLGAEQSARITAELLRIAGRANRHVVQLDFEVRRSQRPFWTETVAAIRTRLDPRIALSVTALASWCLDDYWLQHSRADEIVPMAFRMGAGQHALRQRLQQQRGFTRQRCSAAIGLASDEPPIGVNTARRYVFSPQPWSAASWQAQRQVAQIAR